MVEKKPQLYRPFKNTTSSSKKYFVYVKAPTWLEDHQIVTQ